MGYRLYKPKKGKKKEKMTNIDRLEIAGVVAASAILLGWSGWKVKDTFWPASIETEGEEESETEEMTEETEPMSVQSLEEAAKQEMGDLSSASQWKTAESETTPEPETETQAEMETAKTVDGVPRTEAKNKLPKEKAGPKTETGETETQAGSATGTKIGTETETETEEGTETEAETEAKTEKTGLHAEAETEIRETEHRALKINKEAGTEARQGTEPAGTKLAGTEAKAKPVSETETETATEKETEKETERETEAASGPYLYTSNGILNIRKAPDKGAERLGQCPSGITLDVLEYTEENPRWMKIRYNGIVGYVSAEFVLKTDNPAYTPE